MKNNKLSLVRETILPLTSDDLSQVVGGGIADIVRSQGSGVSRVTQTVVSCGPMPRPGSTLGGSNLSDLGLTIHRPGQVSGKSNAF